MRIFRHGMAWALAFFLLPLAQGQGTAGQPKWIQGSWVNVRAAAQPTAAVVDRWTVNTPVRLLESDGKWCEVAGAGGKGGFIACNLLGDRPLALAEAGNPLRAFWISPSVSRWMAAGQHLGATLLSAAAREKEVAERKLLRFPVPEFDAMKRVMEQGVLIRPEDAPFALQPVSAVADGPGPFPPLIRQLVRQGLLRPVQPSLFTRDSQVLMVGQGDIDAIGAMTNQPVSLRILRRPELYSPYDYETFDGFWDAGEVEIALAAPVVRHAIGTSGLVGAAQARHFRMNGQHSERCGNEVPLLPHAESPLPDYPTVRDPLLEFYLPGALPARKVAVTSRTVKVGMKDPGGNRIASKALLHDIDLDGDGVPDLAVWQGQAPGQISSLLTWWARFVNVNGQWYLAMHFEEPDCT